MRGATTSAQAVETEPEISIHAPHAGRDLTSVKNIRAEMISIHAPHAGRDHITTGSSKQQH